MYSEQSLNSWIGVKPFAQYSDEIYMLLNAIGSLELITIVRYSVLLQKNSLSCCFNAITSVNFLQLALLDR